MTEWECRIFEGDGATAINKGPGDKAKAPSCGSCGLRLESGHVSGRQSAQTSLDRFHQDASKVIGRVTHPGASVRHSCRNKGLQPFTTKGAFRDGTKRQPRLSWPLTSDQQQKSLSLPTARFHLRTHGAAVSSPAPLQVRPRVMGSKRPAASICSSLAAIRCLSIARDFIRSDSRHLGTRRAFAGSNSSLSHGS